MQLLGILFVLRLCGVVRQKRGGKSGCHLRGRLTLQKCHTTPLLGNIPSDLRERQFMNVQNCGDKIRISNDYSWELLNRDEALQLLEDLTEALRMCPVHIVPNPDADRSSTP